MFIWGSEACAERTPGRYSYASWKVRVRYPLKYTLTKHLQLSLLTNLCQSVEGPSYSSIVVFRRKRLTLWCVCMGVSRAVRRRASISLPLTTIPKEGSEGDPLHLYYTSRDHLPRDYGSRRLLSTKEMKRQRQTTTTGNLLRRP